MSNVEPLIPKKPGPKPGRAAMLRAENESLRKRVLELENQIAGFKTATGSYSTAKGIVGVPTPPQPTVGDSWQYVAEQIFVRRIAAMQLEAFPDSVLTDANEADAMRAMWTRVREIALHAASVFVEDEPNDTEGA